MRGIKKMKSKRQRKASRNRRHWGYRHAQENVIWGEIKTIKTIDKKGKDSVQ